MKNLLYQPCLVIILFVFSIGVSAQNDSLKIDSLRRVLAKEKDDITKANALNELSTTLFQKADIENSMRYAKQALSLSEKMNFKIGIGKAYYNIGRAFYGQDNYTEALKNGYTALSFLENVSDKREISQTRGFIGAIYYYQDNDSEALKNFTIALKLDEEMGNKSGIAHNLTEIANIYSDEGKYSDAAVKFTLALDIYKGLGDKAPNWAFPYIYASFGQLYKNEGAAALASGNKILAEKKFSEALKNSQDALKLWRQIGNLTGVAEMYIGLGELYFYLNQNLQAKYFVQKGLQFNINIKGRKDDTRAAYEVLSEIDSANGNYKEAYGHYKLSVLYRDSIINETSTKKSVQVQMQYEFDKKETLAKAAQDKKDAITKVQEAKKDSEARRIKTQQYFAIATLGVIVFAISIIAVIQLRNNKQKQKANKVLAATLTNLKSTQAQLIQSEKMASLGELTAGIAHEIQNPLNFVNNFSEVNSEMIDELQTELKAGNTDEAIAISNDIKENEEKINHHGKRADAIVKGMLQHSKASTGKKEPTDINKLADEYLRLAYHGMRAKDKSFNADFKTDFDDRIGKINIIPQDIGRVLLNLFNNSFYAVNEKKKTAAENYQPTVSVQTKKLNDKVEIVVKDNGNGIPQNIVDKIFQPFFTTKPTGSGTGLGLSLSYDIIKAHGGEIKVETKEGEGSEFVIQLPV